MRIMTEARWDSHSSAVRAHMEALQAAFEATLADRAAQHEAALTRAQDANARLRERIIYLEHELDVYQEAAERARMAALMDRLAEIEEEWPEGVSA